MKLFRILSLAALGFLSFSSVAKVEVFACEPEWAALAQELGGAQIEAFSATTGLQDPHHIQARPSLIAKIRNADLLACTGAELESGWLPLLIQRASNPNLRQGKPGYFMATQFVRLLDVATQIDRSQGDVHAAGNPHIQTNPNNILPIAREMSERLIQLDPGNREQYQQRLEDFTSRWKAALKRWKTMVRPLKHMPIVVHHNSWVYLQDWLKLENLATLEDKPGIPPSSGHLANLLQQMHARPAKVIIHAAYQNGKPAQWLAEKTGIPSVTLPFTVGGNDQATDLFSLYDDTINRLLGAIK